jgi:uncharacterized protein (UPF0332 family)
VKSESRLLLSKAERAIRAAEALVQADESDFAAGRAYYAMLYAAEALLFERGLQFRKHSAVHSAIGEQLVRRGLLDARFHRWLLDAFDVRIQADYGVDALITADEARAVIAQAREFVLEAQRIIEESS